MGKQELIDKIKKEFKGKAMNGNDCTYLNDLGQKCIIGLFVPDGHEAQDSHESVNGILETYPDLKPLMPSQNLNFLMDLQEEHDDLSDLDSPTVQTKMLIDWIVGNYDDYVHTGKGGMP